MAHNSQMIYMTFNSKTSSLSPMKPIQVHPLVANESDFFKESTELPKITVKKTKEKNIYHSLKFLFVLSNILGVLPLQNMFFDPNKMKFSWKNWKISLTIFYIITSLLATVSYTINLLLEFDMEVLEYIVFFGATTISLILYLKLAIGNFPKLMVKWCNIDKIMNKTYQYPATIDRKLLTAFLISGAAVTFNFIFWAIARYYRILDNISGSNFTSTTMFDGYFLPYFEHLPEVNILNDVFTIILSFEAFFIWAFNDLFIILLSMFLAQRFRQILLRISVGKSREKQEKFWLEIRKDFDQLSTLCHDVDSSISPIILLSYTVNIIFMLSQIFHSLKGSHNTIGSIYFVYLFLFIVLKLITVSLCAAGINDESKEIANILCSLPSVSYNTEVRRLLTQISFDDVALTGCKMYKITRGLILNLASAVVTYELVLIQFSQASDVL